MILNFSQIDLITKKYPKETLSNVREDNSFSNF